MKGKTRRLLSPMSQPGFVVQRDNKQPAGYAGRTANVYMNSAIIHSWIKNRWWTEWMRKIKCDNEDVWIEFLSYPQRKKERRSDEQNGLLQSSKMAGMCLACRAPEVWKNGNVSIFGNTICRSCVSSLVGQGLQHMQIPVSQNQYKRSIVRRGIVIALTAELCKPVVIY